MQRIYHQRFVAAIVLAIGVIASVSTCAQESTPPPSANEKSSNQTELALRQGRVADKYARLEQLMLKMAEIDGASNPKRAALLKNAVQQSKDNLTRTQLDTVVKLLDQQKLKRAVDGQVEVTTEMKSLLELLLSENRADRNKGEQDRVKEYIKEVERLIRLQKDVQGRTEGSDRTEKVADDQAKVADRTGDLSKQIQENEEANQPMGGQGTDGQPMPGEKPSDKPADKPMGEDQPKEPQPKEPMPGDMPPAEGKPMSDDKSSEKEDKPGENKPSEGKPMPGSPMPGQPMPDQPKEGEPMPGGQGQPMPMPPSEPQAQQNPARQRLQAAEQKMRDAQKKLDEAKRDEAKEAQEAARQELEKAKAELEQILRQLREEEIERTLAQLEARFRKMLEMQLRVNEATDRLAAIPEATRGREVDIESGKLAVEQRKIGLEADKAYNLLLEEGSSIAFPESVEQMRGDMEQVANWLAKSKIDAVTLGVEEDIVTTLNELIAALQQAQKDQEKKQEEEQGKPLEQGEEQDQPLVDKIAELKMIKAMQKRVNDRTQRFAKLIPTPDDPAGQATDADLRQAVQQLGDRQSKLQRITRDIVLGKNQ